MNIFLFIWGIIIGLGVVLWAYQQDVYTIYAMIVWSILFHAERTRK